MHAAAPVESSSLQNLLVRMSFMQLRGLEVRTLQIEDVATSSPMKALLLLAALTGSANATLLRWGAWSPL